MAIVFKDINSIEVDGVNAGDLVSVMANYPTRKNELLRALADFRKEETKARTEALRAMETSHLEAIAKLTDDHDKAIAIKQVKIAELQQDIEDIHALLGGDPNIKRIKRQREKEAAQAAIAEANKRIAEIDAEVIE